MKKFFELYKVPEVAEKYINSFVSEFEIKIISDIGSEIISDDEIKKIIHKEMKFLPGYEVDSYVYRLYSRAIIDKVIQDQNTYWQIGDFWARMTYMSQFEASVWKKMPEELRDALDKEYLKRYADNAYERLKKVQKGELPSIENAYFLTLEEALATIEAHNSIIYLVPCNCKTIKLACENKKEDYCCMSFTIGTNTAWDRGHGTEISKEEAKKLIKKFRDNGLMQTSETEWGFCNCCGCCCYPIRAAEELKIKGQWPLSRYEIIWNKDKCINCGICVKQCNFGAFTKEDGKVKFNKEKCWGCTICYERCPKSAISLKKIVDDSVHGLKF